MTPRFGKYIRQLRTDNGMTQAALAARLHVTDKAVSKWERDLSYPDISLFPRLAEVLGVSVSELISAADNGGEPEQLTQIYRVSHDIRTPIHIIIGWKGKTRGKTCVYCNIIIVKQTRTKGNQMPRTV